MELKAYWRVVVSKWWIVLPTFLATLAAAAFLTFSQDPTYESTATYVVKVGGSSLDQKALVSALDALTTDQIETTFSEVGNSHLIRTRAMEALGLNGKQVRDVSVSSRVLVGTNVMQITVQGPDPVLVRDIASATGMQTATYVQGLYGAYEMQLLDQATLPASPVKPRIALNLIFGVIGGLVLGAGLAFFAEYLQMPLEEAKPGSKLSNAKGAGQVLVREASATGSSRDYQDADEVGYSRNPKFAGLEEQE